MRVWSSCTFAAGLAAAVACAPRPPIHASSTPSVTAARRPPREPGCRIDVVKELPPSDRVDLGIIEAECEAHVGIDACERALEDEACKLGGTMLWGEAEPRKASDTIRLRAQAAAEPP